MSSSTVDLNEWLNAMHEATHEMATSTLNLEACQFIEILKNMPVGVPGAYISLVIGDHDGVTLGILAKHDDCASMAKAMLGMGQNDGALPESDIADALGEICNIIAGGVKRLVSDRLSQIQLGLPMFMTGQVECGEHQDLAIAKVTVGKLPAYLIVIKKRNS